MSEIKTWQERCEEHPDHQSGMVTHGMIKARMQEEIDDLRNQCEMWADACAMVEMNRDQLRTERDALRADAERWRYLRTRRWIEIAAGSVDFSIAGPDASAETQTFRDSEIDAALAARGKDE